MMVRWIFIFSIFASSSVVLAGPTIWTVQSHKSEASIFHQNFKKYVVVPINKELKGQLEIRLFAQGENRLHSNRSSFSEVRHGRVSGRFSATMYWGGADPVFAIAGDLIAAWETEEDFFDWFDNYGGEAFVQKAYSRYNSYFVGYALSPQESLVAKFPITDIKSLKGKTIRTPPGSMGRAFFEALGAVSRSFPMSKVSSSLRRSAIDAADYSTIGLNLQEGVYKHAKHTNYPGFHSLPVLEFVVNLQKWNRLSLNEKDVIKKHVRNWQKMNTAIVRKLEPKHLAQLKVEGVTLHRWSPLEMRKARTIAIGVWDEFALKSPQAKAIVESIKKWLRDNNKL